MNGERTPTEVYQDFRAAVFDILSQQENQEALLNGVAGMGNGAHNIPGSIVSVDTAPSKREENAVLATEGRLVESSFIHNSNMNGNSLNSNTVQVPISLNENGPKTNPFNLNRIPHIIWVIGGPGSNKATLCLKAVGVNPGWGHIR